jgi:glycosyltransferase involved in cell wall biosynthesis
LISYFLRKLKSLNYYSGELFNIIKGRITELLFVIKVFVLHKFIYRQIKIGIGTIFQTKGGVYNHIIGLNTHLKTKNITIPSRHINELLVRTNYYKLYMGIVSRNKLFQHQIVHSHADPWFIMECNKLQKKGIKWVHTYHLPYFEEAHGKLENWQIEMNDALFNIAPNADIKISVAKWEQKFLKETYNIDSIYIPNCADLSKCGLANKNRFIAKYGIENFMLFASSTLYVKNAIEYILLAKELPQYSFVMIGNNMSVINAEAIYQNKLPKNLIILNDYFEHQDLLDAIAACSVFIITSRIEGLPTTLMEAMAIGKPVVASNVNGCNEVIGDGEFGFLYELGNIQDLVYKTVLARSNNAFCQPAKHRVYNQYNWAIVAPKIDEIYSSLL